MPTLKDILAPGKIKDLIHFGKAEKLKPVRPVTPKPEPIPVPKDPTITDK